jgi:hypothetical protein
MKILKLILNFVWTISLQNIFLWIGMLWKWLWSKTEVDEKAIAALKEAKRRTINVVEESKDVIDAAKGKKSKK